MTGNFKLNDDGISYLIHGQYFKLDYEITSCLFVFISYDRGESFFSKFSFRKKKGIFESITNCYKPRLTIYAFGLGVQKFTFDLKINFINTHPPLVDIKQLKLPSSPKILIEKREPEILSPSISIIQTNNFKINNNQLNIKNYDDIEDFKKDAIKTTNI